MSPENLSTHDDDTETDSFSVEPDANAMPEANPDAAYAQSVETGETPSESGTDGESRDKSTTGSHTGERRVTDDVAPVNSKDGKPASVLESLPVHIDFRVGQLTVPVSALASLAPGYTFPVLEGASFPMVQAVTGGKVFAEGELVDIEGHIGFRILRLMDG